MKNYLKKYGSGLAIITILTVHLGYNLSTYESNIFSSKKSNAAEIVTGKARIIDGDTIEISNKKIRLSDIDAVEKDQKCYKNNQVWNCGIDAKEFLEKTIATETVFCTIEGQDFYRRFLATCYVNKSNNQINLNKLMVESGWAVKYKTNKYYFEEILAKANRRNIWSSEFELPENHRKNKKK